MKDRLFASLLIGMRSELNCHIIELFISIDMIRAVCNMNDRGLIVMCNLLQNEFLLTLRDSNRYNSVL